MLGFSVFFHFFVLVIVIYSVKFQYVIVIRNRHPFRGKFRLRKGLCSDYTTKTFSSPGTGPGIPNRSTLPAQVAQSG